MDVIDKYLYYLQEQEIGRIGIPKKKPSPSFAYELVYNKPAPKNRRGRPPFPTEHKVWNGMEVDKHLKDKWLKDLNNIPNVEIRGSCEGHSDEWITYIAFRLDPKFDKNKSFLNKVVSRLNKGKNTKCGFDIGTANRPRFICASPLYYKCKKHVDWIKWWESLSSRLNKAVNI